MKRAARILPRRLRSIGRRVWPDPDVNRAANPLRAHRCRAGQVERWHPVPAANAPGEAGSLADGIFQPPGFVTVDGSVFDLRTEGVYRFYRLSRLSEQRIVWHGGLDSLLSMLGYLWLYGNVDDPMEPGSAFAAVRRRVIVATCTSIAHLAVAVLAAGNVTARPVLLITLDEWGGQDDGHTLVEVQSGEAGWFLYDPSFNICFAEKGHRLSLVKAVESLKHQYAVLERLPGNTGHGAFRAHGFDYGFWVDERLQSNAILGDWYRRMAGVPLVYDDGTFFFADDGLTNSDRERLARRYRAIKRDAFLTRFYGTSIASGPPSVSPTGIAGATEHSRGTQA